jgi:hypothetical protein
MGINLTFLVVLGAMKTIALEWRTIIGMRKLTDDGSGQEKTFHAILETVMVEPF